MRETRTHQNKYTFQYIFQNTLLKLLRPISNFPSIHILYHDKHYFVLNKPDVFPTLINLPAVSCITFNNVKVTLDHIYQILNNSSTLSFPFTIKLFTSYSYIKSTSKQMHNNMIGQYLNSHQKECLYIFITPCLARNNMFLHRLQELNNLTFNRTNLFTNSRHREGKQTNYTSLPLPKITNQKYCICQHEETQEITLPRKYNHIGIWVFHKLSCSFLLVIFYLCLVSRKSQKYFLQEHLGKKLNLKNLCCSLHLTYFQLVWACLMTIQKNAYK